MADLQHNSSKKSGFKQRILHNIDLYKQPLLLQDVAIRHVTLHLFALPIELSKRVLSYEIVVGGINSFQRDPLPGGIPAISTLYFQKYPRLCSR